MPDDLSSRFASTIISDSMTQDNNLDATPTAIQGYFQFVGCEVRHIATSAGCGLLLEFWFIFFLLKILSCFGVPRGWVPLVVFRSEPSPKFFNIRFFCNFLFDKKEKKNICKL